PPAGSSPAARSSAPVTPPALDGGTAGAHGPAHGNAAFSYAPGARGEVLTVAVSCRGAGTVQVRIPVLHAGFPVACGAGKPAVTSHALALPAAHRAGTVRVTAPSGVTWAVTVGRDGPAEIPPA
ncbi:hypothetical protein AB0450_29945, partial [Streptomyces sp. NPDC093808]